MKKLITIFIACVFLAACAPMELPTIAPVTQIPFYSTPTDTPLPFIVPVTETPIVVVESPTDSFIIPVTETPSPIPPSQ
ncbi:MAG: hypothetical protein ACK40V_09870, partial [Anaerolineales bacterium]